MANVKTGVSRKSTPNFPKNEYFLPPVIWRALFSWNTRYEILPFALLPTSRKNDDCSEEYLYCFIIIFENKSNIRVFQYSWELGIW